MTDHERAQRLAEIRARADKATPGPWRDMADGNQYVETKYLPTAKCVAAARVDGLVRPWNPYAYVRFGFTAEAFEVSRFLANDAEFIAHARADVPFLLAEIDRLSAAPPSHARARQLIEQVNKFIEYARYELQPGEPTVGSQFPHQADADRAIAKLNEVAGLLSAPVQETAATLESHAPCPGCVRTQSVIETKGHGPACWGTPEELAPRAVCLDCGLPYEEFGGLDILLPRSQWLVIHPDENGLLCAMCIVRRAAKIPECSAIQATLEILPRRQLDVVGRPDPATPRSQGTELRGGPDSDPVCQHGTALDVHCCNCHSGFIFDKDHECPPAAPDLRAQIEALLPDLIDVLRHVNVLDCGAHYCRYCPAKSPDWDHTPGCPYVESQHANNRARAMRTTLADLLPAPEKETR